MSMLRFVTLTLAIVLLLPAISQVAAAQIFEDGTHTGVNPQTAARQAANDALAAHDFEQAVKLLTPLAAANSNDAQLLYDLGSAEDALDQTPQAEKSYRVSIADDSTLLAPRVALGLLLARSGRREEARAEFVAATGMASKADVEAGNALKARAYRSLARLDQKTRPAEARDELVAALKLSPETPEDALQAAELSTTLGGDSTNAEAEYRRVLSARPNDPQATAALAHLMVTRGRQAEAETLLNDALKVNQQEPALTTQLASLYASEDKAAEAIPLVETLHAANPKDADVTHLLAGLYVQTRNYAQAEPLLAQLSLARPEDPSAASDRADALIHLKRYAEAEQILLRLVAQPTQFKQPADLGAACGELAFAASENNHPAETLHALSVRATVLPSTPATLFLAAISEDKLHHVKAAIQAYKDFLAASNGRMADQDFEAQHRLVALEHMQ